MLNNTIKTQEKTEREQEGKRDESQKLPENN